MKIRTLIKPLFLIGSCLLIVGCATTEYTQREGSFWGSGYYDRKIQEGIYKVGYTGNTSTSGDAAEDLAFLRAADVTVQNGYNYFIVIDDAKRTNTHSSYTPLLPHTYKGNTYYTGGYSSSISTPDNEITIRCYVNKPLDTKETIYDAKEIKLNLGKKYDKKKTEDTKKTTPSETALMGPSIATSDEKSSISLEDKAAAESAFDAALSP